MLIPHCLARVAPCLEYLPLVTPVLILLAFNPSVLRLEWDSSYPEWGLYFDSWCDLGSRLSHLTCLSKPGVFGGLCDEN